VTYPSDVPEICARFRPVPEVESLAFNSGTVARLVAPGLATNGQFGLFEWNMLAGKGSASPHFHKKISESFFVTAGRVRLYDGENWVIASKGDFLYVPEGGVHGFRNDFDEAASMLILFSPGVPREQYFRELIENAASGRQLSSEERAEMLARHDQYAIE
jgi:quercetin dioxygenase-like cupin family protein